MQSNPRLLVNLPVILAKTLVNLLVKTDQIRFKGAMGGPNQAVSRPQEARTWFSRESPQTLQFHHLQGRQYSLRGGLWKGVQAPPWPPKPNLVSFTSKITSKFTNIS